MSATRRSVPGLVLATLVLCACDSAGKQPTCAELVQAEEFESAVEQCAQDFRSGDDTAAGILLVEALYALERYERVLATADRLVGTPREAEARVFAGMAHSELGDIDSSIHSFERAATLQRDGGETRSLANSLYWLFWLNWNESRLRESLEYASALYEVGLELDDVGEQRLALSSMFTGFYDLGDLAAARWALSRERELIDPEDKTAVAYNFSHQGNLFSAEGRVALARDAYEKSLRLALETEDRGIARASHLNLVEVHLRLGDLDRAEENLEGAARELAPGQDETAGLLYYRGLVGQARGDLDAARTAYEKAIKSDETPDDWRWNIEYRLGQLAAARADKKQAEAAFRRAIEVVERMRSSLGGDSLKAWLLDKKRQPYEALFALQVSESRNRDALETLERAKARAFLDALIHSASTDGWIVEDSDDLPTTAAERLGALRSVLPAMTESPVAVHRPIDEVLAALGDRQVLIYYIAGDRPWLISVSGGETRILELDRPAEEMRRLARRFRADPDAAGVAEELADSLLPSSMMPEPGSRLTIVTDDFLGEIPYAALRRAGRYLVQDHVLSYAPSITALTVIDNRSRVAGGSAVVLGDPAGDLAGAAREAEEVASTMGVEAHVGGDATLATLRAARAAPLLHVASHTGLGPSGPWLALAEGPVGIDAILADRIGPQVVVLASCSSAAREGKGLWGSLGAGFLAAGSRQVLASLWSVDDHKTREFIRRFYAEGGATDPAGALARVQRIWVAGNRRAFDWAPYVVLGAHEETRGIAN